VIHAYRWAKVSVSVAVAYRWDGRRARLFFQTRPGSYNSTSLVTFLKDLKRHFPGQRARLIWDGLPAHKSREMLDYLATQRSWLTVERLPGYAPELNPVELVWGNVKGQELANQTAEDLGAVGRALRTGLGRVRQRPTLLWGFLNHAGLSL
jgi:DDE superfamily endonuclease